MMYTVLFKHTKISNSGYSYKTVDWTMVEAETQSEAKEEARRWVREYRWKRGCKNRTSILEVREIK